MSSVLSSTKGLLMHRASHRRLARLAGAFGAATVIAGAVAVFAGGPQGPGTVCNPVKGHASRINYTQSKGVENLSSSSSATVFCPIDFTSNPSVLQPSAIQIAYRAAHPTIPVVCTVYAHSSDGFPIWDETLDDTNNPAGTFDFQIISAWELGAEYFTVACTLPLAPSSSTRSQIITWQSGQNIL